ncbi:MAG: acetolactate synthase [bacterium]|nr:acetolactate synthase [bacterium]
MGYACEKVEQLTLFLENRPGILADLCAHMAESGVNIRATTTLEGRDCGVVRLVVDKTEDAKATLTNAGVAFTTTECLALRMPNHPGGFAGAARVLSLAGVNIDYIYASTIAGAQSALGIFGVSDLDKALSLNWSETR